MTAQLPHILILASWYPNVESPYNGDFIQQIANETSLNYRVTVLQIVRTQHHNTGKGLVKNKVNERLEEWVFYSYKKGIFGFLASGAKLFKQIQKERGKVSFCHVQVIWKMGLLALWLKMKFKLPYVVTEHWTGYLPEHFQYKKKTLRMFTKHVARNASGIATVSHNLGNTLVKLRLTKDFTVIPNVVRYKSEPGKGSESGYFTFVHLSNLRPQHKNTIGIVRAFAQAVMSEPNIKLILAGSGSREDEEEIKQIILQLGIKEDNFLFLSQLPHSEAIDLMGKSDALICFSNFETFNITCAESVCMGTPVIYTACGGPEEYLDQDMGVEVPRQNKLQLSKLMLSMARKELVFDRNLVAQKGRTLFNSAQWAEFTKSFYQNSGLLL